MPVHTLLHATVTVTFTGISDPAIAIDPTSGLEIAENVASVVRKPGEAHGVYIVTLGSPIAAMTMVPRCVVWCESAGKQASVHPNNVDGMVQELEIRGTFTEGVDVGTLTDIMFILKIENQWRS